MASLHTMPGGTSAAAADVAAAIERVLRAERDATADLEAARGQCAARIAEARAQARRILEQAERVAQAIHARTERVAELRAAAAAREACPPDATTTDVEAVADRLAAELTGDGDA